MNGCSEKQPDITIYGSNQCHHCTDLKASLDSAGINYTFYDIDQSEQFAQEMFDKLQKTNQFSFNVSLPVVELGDQKVLPGANFERVLHALKE